MTLQQIGERFGVTRQAIHERLVKAGVKCRPRSTKRKSFDRDLLYQLYVVDGQTLAQVGERLGVSLDKISYELNLYGIKRRKTGPARRKYVKLFTLGVQELIVIPRPSVKYPHVSLHSAAKRIGIRISIRTIDKSHMSVTRAF